ncbi:hypothetical protein HPB49_016806 [Dermacentor silvarum]|uniref:Uncharacterized protein n=1 Tax=Dermacentor silvarum TaxID=543639 RepID=A0ACB8E144_DERSI|nr:hypothetical protein HPB49_016806 [Dermacentor silvarum]
MRHCCVPLCTPSQRKTEPGVLFHEIPADPNARARWLKAISRKDWEPNSASSYSVVCSMHVNASDLKDNCKNRQLKPGVVPSIFCGYPSYMRKAPASTRRDASIRKAPKSNNPLHGLIAHQDRGRLYYPSEELVNVLRGLRRFADTVLSNRCSIAKPLEVSVERSILALMKLPVLRCEKWDEKQRKMVLHLIAKKFMKAIFTNYAVGVTDRNRATKLLERKPLSRKGL